MITPRIRPLVSPAAALAAALALAACAGPARRASDQPARASLPPIAIHFENYARDHVHVYLVGERREWLLGRVDPLARVRLRVPGSALVDSPGFMRLVVIPGQRVSMRAAEAAGATVTMTQPVTAILAHQWTFSESATTGHLSALRVPRVRAGAGRP